jgi:quercetin dioxygenase-like cupin family protein
VIAAHASRAQRDGHTGAVSEETLHLNAHERVRVLRETPQELELEASWDPGGSRPPAHLHPAQDEHFEVLAGQLTAIVGGAQRVLARGERLDIPRGTPHAMWNSGGERAFASWRTRPAGRTAEWFRRIDRLGEGGRRTPPLPAMAAALTSFGDVFRLAVGPRPLWPAVRAALRVVALGARRS